MSIVTHFAINWVRSAKDKHSIKTRRKIAGWDTKYLAELPGVIRHYAGFGALFV